jgi:hypothetical protein
MAYGEQAQAGRQQEANTLQSNREQTAQNLQSNAQQYRGGYPYGYPAWDAGAGWAAAATGAAVGAAATAAATAHAGSSVYTASEPCANPASVSVGGTVYFRCGSSWFTQAYGPSGPGYVAVAPPPGL